MQKGTVKKFFQKALSWAGLFFFLLAGTVLYLQLSKYSWEEIRKPLFEIPRVNLIYACIASFLGYIALSSYDFLALKYIRRHVSPLKWMFAGFIGFCVSNNAGHAIVSGGAIRYRLYSRWHFNGGEIIRMVIFSGFTYLVACFFLSVVGYLLTPDHAYDSADASKYTAMLVAIGSFIGLLIYFGLCFIAKKPLIIHDIPFKMPSFKMALAQVVIGSCDILMASFVLYFCLMPFVQLPFDVFMGVFIIAQVLGVFSQVPGGLGVFEGLFLAILPSDAEVTDLFGALIAYRIIYYLLPMVISAGALLTYELYLHFNALKLKK